MYDITQKIYKKLMNYSLPQQIFISMMIASLFSLLLPDVASYMAILGTIFISALKSIAPILVFTIVLSSIANQQKDINTSHIKNIIILYLIGTFAAALIAVIFNMIFQVHVDLPYNSSNIDIAAPSSITTMFTNLLLQAFDNPISALYNANYIGILVWSIALGIAFLHAKQSTKQILEDLSNGITYIVKLIISFAPIGIFGIVCNVLSTTGFSAFLQYFELLFVLVLSITLTALVLNPIIIYFYIKKNPYPLILKCLQISGISAFFMRSSAGNIPVNMQLCEDLHLNKNIYSMSIPIGANINMAGAAITITTFALTAAYSMNIEVTFFNALLTCIVASVSACGASGVAGGSLLLIPFACSLFNISNEVAMEFVSIGFIIGIIQDSMETALNSSTDVIFTAAVSEGENLEI